MRKSIPLEEAQQLLQEYAGTTGVEEISIVDALGRTAAEDIVTGFPLPPFNRSPLDGYALIAADTAGAGDDSPVGLRVVQTVYAGDVPAGPLAPGEAAAVTTGAPLPEGSDAVIRFEDTRREGDTVFVSSVLRSRENFVPAGEDVPAGEKILSKGVNITPAAVGLLASLGRERVKVYKRPRVTVFSTGSELLELGRELAPGKIYNSNLYSLSAQVREAGGEAVRGRAVFDDKDAIAEAMRRTLEESDMIVTSGGVSVGDKDYVKEAMVLSGAQMLFWRVRMKPGSPAACAQKNGKLIMGLSGNPSAAMITFTLLVRPVLQAMGGRTGGALPEVTAFMEAPFAKSSGQRRMLRAVLRWKDGAYHAVPAGLQSPGALRSMLLCNALVDIPAGHGPLETGDKVRALLLPPPYCL